MFQMRGTSTKAVFFCTVIHIVIVQGNSVPHNEWYFLRVETVCQNLNQIITITIITPRKTELLSPQQLYCIHDVAQSQRLQAREIRIVSSKRYNVHTPCWLNSFCVPTNIPCVFNFPYFLSLMFPSAWLRATSVVSAFLSLLFWTRLMTLFSKLKEQHLFFFTNVTTVPACIDVWGKQSCIFQNKDLKSDEKKTYFQVVSHPFSEILLWIMNGFRKQNLESVKR